VVAYYDGSIHVSGDLEKDGPEIGASLRHEYIHHALAQYRVRHPTWLQEGLAMYAAGEDWWVGSKALESVVREPFPLAHMTWVFPHGNDKEFASAAYVESILMVRMIVDLRGEQRLRELIDALARGTLSPENSFVWACDLPETDVVARWRNFLWATGKTAATK
jgi:hypothetical protein